MWRRVGAGGSGASLGRNTTGRGSRYPELDCVRGHVAPEVLTAAEDRAARVGIGADRALIAAGASSAVLGWIGLSRRRMTRTAWILLLTPLHWLLLSWAA